METAMRNEGREGKETALLVQWRAAVSVRSMASVVHVVPRAVFLLRFPAALGGTRGVSSVEVVEPVEFQECPVSGGGDTECASEFIEENTTGLRFVPGRNLGTWL